jgi:hypothetical protein
MHLTQSNMECNNSGDVTGRRVLVSWKGDNGKLCDLGNEIIDGMSAIVRIFTSEGFLVAADGRGISGLPGVPDKDCFQKIFHLSHSGNVIASVCGVSQLRQEDGEVFDIGAALRAISRKIKSKSASNVHEYAGLLMGELGSLVAQFYSDAISKSSDPETLIFLDGLFAHVMPERETICIAYGESGTVVSSNATDLSIAAYASQKIWNMLFGHILTTPQWIAPYREICQGGRRTLSEAVRVARSAILAHSQPEAIEIDPEPCRAIGGRIHIATLTPREGFKWVAGYEPISPL